MGVVVGWFVPPAGSTVRPSSSPASSPDASTGVVAPDTAGGSSPARLAAVPFAGVGRTTPFGIGMEFEAGDLMS